MSARGTLSSAPLIDGQSEIHDRTMSAEVAVFETHEPNKVFGSVGAVDKVSFKLRKGKLAVA